MKRILSVALVIALFVSMSIFAMAEKSNQWAKGLKIGLAQMHYTNAFRKAETDSVLKAFQDAGVRSSGTRPVMTQLNK